MRRGQRYTTIVEQFCTYHDVHMSDPDHEQRPECWAFNRDSTDAENLAVLKKLFIIELVKTLRMVQFTDWLNRLAKRMRL